MLRSLLLIALTAFLTASGVGCSDQYDGRYAVSGQVTLEGKPLDEGSIQFTPTDGQDTSGGGEIKDGRYEIDRKGGLKPGKYMVRITSGDGTHVPNEEEAAAPGGSTNIISVDRIPPEWNIRSEKYVEVKADGDNEFDFAIPKAYEAKGKRR